MPQPQQYCSREMGWIGTLWRLSFVAKLPDHRQEGLHWPSWALHLGTGGLFVIFCSCILLSISCTFDCVVCSRFLYRHRVAGSQEGPLLVCFLWLSHLLQLLKKTIHSANGAKMQLEPWSITSKFGTWTRANHVGAECEREQERVLKFGILQFVRVLRISFLQTRRRMVLLGFSC